MSERDTLRLTGIAVAEAAAVDGEYVNVSGEVYTSRNGATRAHLYLSLGVHHFEGEGVTEDSDPTAACLRSLANRLEAREGRLARDLDATRRVRAALAAALTEVQS